ncbi:MAG TPA: type II secretion system protein GspN [Syntrophales bacterium]|nr:type II secretion system protein GspN [Syntrophales bacterium]HPQ43905.1 type II secretion system protein GspN [Syntrophales bacterium]
MKKKVAGYILYAILITVVFLYCCFPDTCVRTFIESAVSKNNPDISVSLDSASLAFPLAMTGDNLVFGRKDDPGTNVKIDHVKARLLFGKLLQGNISVSLQAHAYGGDVLADILFADRFSTSGPVQSQIRLNNIAIGQCSYLKTALNRHITGRLTGSVEFSGKTGDMINGKGTADLKLRNGELELLKALLGLGKLNFDVIETNIALKDRVLTIDEADISGEQLNGSFNGNIALNNNILNSRIAIKGRANVPAFNKNISVVLSGTLANPRHKIR